MANISFYYTQEPIIDEIKDVTRRLGWRDLKVGAILIGIVKGQGLKAGEKIQKLCKLEVLKVTREPLYKMLKEPYGSRAEAGQ